MLNYSDFIVGLWLVPVVFCIVLPLAFLCLYTIKCILDEIASSLNRAERALSQGSGQETGEASPLATA